MWNFKKLIPRHLNDNRTESLVQVLVLTTPLVERGEETGDLEHIKPSDESEIELFFGLKFKKADTCVITSPLEKV